MNIQETIKNMEKRGFIVRYFETDKEAAKYLGDTLTGKTVGIGGSVTIRDHGFYDAIKDNNNVLWHYVDTAPDTSTKAFHAPIYISSANAIAETGEIINIDGRGNRAAAIMYDKELVYIIAGVNKIAPTIEDAMKRAREIAAPLNAKRIGTKTPCVADGKCHDCNSPERICNMAVTLMGRPLGIGRLEVILVNQDMGY